MTVGKTQIGFFKHLRFIVPVSFILLATIFSIQSAHSGQKLTNANEIVRTMMRTYRNARTIRDVAQAKITQIGKTTYIQTNITKFRRPSSLLLQTEDPVGGTFTAYANERTLTIYSGRQNVYTRRNSGIDLQTTMKKISVATKDTVGVDQEQILSPISFVAAKQDMPEEAKNFRLIGVEKHKGRSAYRVRGEMNANWIQKLMPSQSLILQSKSADLWIDTETFYLLRMTVEVIASTKTERMIKLQGMNKPQKVTIFVGFKIDETHSETKLNTPLRDEDFKFIEPKGSVQLFQNQQEPIK